MIQTKQELIETVRANEEKILSFGVKRLGLFGSFVREEHDNDSDIDFLVDFKKKHLKLKNLVDLGYFLQDVSGRKVEVITRGSLSKYFGHRILNETEYIISA
ncbi:MAG: nucleotidyltransferase family protein [Chitinophagales bacterium]